MTEKELQSLLDSMTLEEKVGQLVQCNAGQFIANDMEITGPEGQPLPAEDLIRVIGSVLTFEDASQAKALQACAPPIRVRWRWAVPSTMT